jgi:energy-coupling factor transporter ATP-binding protein EcfA2
VLDDDASNVSAGKMPRLTIAWEFLAKPSALILDEATRRRGDEFGRHANRGARAEGDERAAR